jgi:hypothetical protein
MPLQFFAATGIQPYLLTFTMVCSLCESAPITLFSPLLTHIRVTYRSQHYRPLPQARKAFPFLIPLAHFVELLDDGFNQSTSSQCPLKDSGRVGREERIREMTTVERLYQEAKALPPDDLRRLIELLSQAELAKPAMTEEEFQAHLMSEGVISELPKPLEEREEEVFRPIRVQGQPLSETIIEERR